MMNGRIPSCAGLLFVHTLITKVDTGCKLEAASLPDPCVVLPTTQTSISADLLC